MLFIMLVMCSIACQKDLNRAENKETELHFYMDVQTVDDNDGEMITTMMTVPAMVEVRGMDLLIQ